MKKSITVRSVTIGEGLPKICVSLTSKTKVELVEEALFLKTVDLDIVEWRVDFFEEVESIESVKGVLIELREVLIEKPLIFTFRSRREGGEKEISSTDYFDLNKSIIQSGIVDIVDVELFQEEETVIKLVSLAHSHGVFVIISNHDFEKTPSKVEIVSRLLRAQDLGGDLPKIAVMPNNARDVLTLLDATLTMSELHPDLPIITISMGSTGVISRLTGNLFGSVLTFAAGKKGSAPGQITVNEMREVLKLI